ncbi:MAG: hypothetical protein MZV65_21260, partial [Chromatiales bacterium]|nr:hypothetical protein [Chromatiales bacterium]
LYFVQLRIAKVKQTTTNGIDSTYDSDRRAGAARAALVEENARLLDSLESLVPSGLLPFVTEGKGSISARSRATTAVGDRARPSMG